LEWFILEQEMRICIVEEQSRQEHFHQEIEFIYVIDGGIDLILAGTLCHLTKESICEFLV